ncbi:unnamed protein product [Fraxinus pennsylvanica]|uniref:Uncharacterized protein n=1 Tax=Fraxinus pennsylvanica TaxID=56036 RepID=A0AAD1Z2G4_9LAMI|nr:unnamed protein product [Fraxinus pennsylvanica]
MPEIAAKTNVLNTSIDREFSLLFGQLRQFCSFGGENVSSSMGMKKVCKNWLVPILMYMVEANRVPRHVIENVYKFSLPKPKLYEPQSQPPLVAEFLRSYCKSRGYVASSGLPDGNLSYSPN